MVSTPNCIIYNELYQNQEDREGRAGEEIEWKPPYTFEPWDGYQVASFKLLIYS